MKPVSLLILAAFCGVAGADELRVVAWSPSGENVQDGVSQITATFNRPAAALGAQMQNCPFTMTPALKGRCRWAGTQTLIFEPDTPLAPATGYEVKIAKQIVSQPSCEAMPEDFKWTFATERPQLRETKPEDGSGWIDVNAVLFARFTLPMQQSLLRDFVVLEEKSESGGKSEVALGIRHATAEEIKSLWGDYALESDKTLSTSTVMALKPARPLHPESRYRLVFKKDMPAETGNLGIIAERVVNFSTWRNFAFAGASAPSCLPGEAVVSFTNPVRYGDLLDNLSLEPSSAAAKAAEGYRRENTGDEDADKRVYSHTLSWVPLSPGNPVKFTIRAGLKDAFGNVLEKDAQAQLIPPDYCPRMSMSEGFGILESYGKPRHPVTAINVMSAAIQKKAVAENEIIPLYNDMVSGATTWYEGAPAQRWNPNDKRNISVRTFADLSPALKGKGGVVFLRVNNDGTQWHSAADNVTRLGLMFKTSPQSSLVWVSYLKTGAPAAGVPVQIRGDDNKILWRGATGRDGFAQAPGWAKLGAVAKNRWERPRLWVFAKDPQGMAVLASDFHGGIEPWRFNVSSDYSPAARDYRGELYAERGVYRPGETVNLKAVFRKNENGDWAYPGVKTVLVTIQDPRGVAVYSSTAAVSGLGSFDLSYKVGELASTGWWNASAAEYHQPPAKPAKDDEGDDIAAEKVMDALTEREIAAQAEGRPEPDLEQLVGGKGGNAALAGGGLGTEQGGAKADEAADPDASGGSLRLEAQFRVEAFKPAVFETRLIPDATQYFPGGEMRMNMEAYYLQGAPLAGAPVEWKMQFFPVNCALSLCRQDYWFGKTAQFPVSDAVSGISGLNADGKAVITVALPAGYDTALYAVFEVSATSPERQRLFAREEVMLHPAEFYPGIRYRSDDRSNSFAKGKPALIDLAAARYDGVLASGVPVECAVERREHVSVRRVGIAGRLEWASEEKRVPVSTFSFVSSTGPYTLDFSSAAAGEYVITASATDSLGRKAVSSSSFFVFGDGEGWWPRRDTDIIELVADKKSYKPGETAQILVKSPYSETRAIVTIEREGVMDKWLTRFNGGVNYITVPITDAHVPNVYVGVALVQGRTAENKFDDEGLDAGKPQAKFGYINLNVDPGGRKLDVAVSSDKTDYRPGGEVTLEVAASLGGRPADAEVSVAVVDEGVLALTGYRAPDIFGSFYGPRPLAVWTADSRLYVIGERNFGQKGENRGGGGSGSGGGGPGVDLRSRFVPTAYWNPSVRTGPSGRAKVSFKLPDNITRFRVIAVAHTLKQFGYGEAAFTVSQPLALRPSLPRFARNGDMFRGGVVAGNYTGADSTVTVSIEPSGDAVRVGSGWARDVFIPQGRSAEITWDMTAVRQGESSFAFKALSGGESDGLLKSLNVSEPVRLQTAAASGVTESSVSEQVAKPPASSDARADITVSPSAAGGLKESMKFLLDYPYGCLEQKISALMPYLAGGDMAENLGITEAAQWKPAAQKTIDSFAAYQHPSGGFGYWSENPQPDPYITAYALDAFSMAKEAGLDAGSAPAAAAKWLEQWLSDQSRWAYPYSQPELYAARAYALYALSLHGRPQPGVFGSLYENRGQLPLSGRAWLLKSAPYMTAVSSAADALSGEILSMARYSPETMHFEDAFSQEPGWLHQSPVTETAVCLDALLAYKKGFPGDEKAVRWLVQERKNAGRWRTTHENAAVLRALSRFYGIYEKDEGSFTGYVFSEPSGDRKLLWTGDFVNRTPLSASSSFKLDALSGADGTARLLFSLTGKGRLYYNIALRYYPQAAAPAENAGFEVERKTVPLRCVNAPSVQPCSPPALSERAVVTLTVKTRTGRSFVALEDPVPAGYEIVDPSFSVESSGDAAALDKAQGEADWMTGFTRHEIYDDRIIAFADYLPAGEHKYSYLVQAVTPGKFAQPPAYAEQMYEPEVYGHNAAAVVEIGR
ncbi:MAG: alpha-2-macroglobulin family protein [Elusimicrobiales bacterium]